MSKKRVDAGRSAGDDPALSLNNKTPACDKYDINNNDNESGEAVGHVADAGDNKYDKGVGGGKSHIFKLFSPFSIRNY